MQSPALWLLLVALAGCSRVHEPAAVLTLVPAAMRSGGATTAVAGGARCLQPGGFAEATVYVYEPTVTMTLTLRQLQPGDAIPLVVVLGARPVATESIRSPEPQEFTYRVRAPQGDQILQLSVPAGDGRAVCVQQIALTQP